MSDGLDYEAVSAAVAEALDRLAQENQAVVNLFVGVASISAMDEEGDVGHCLMLFGTDDMRPDQVAGLARVIARYADDHVDAGLYAGRED